MIKNNIAVYVQHYLSPSMTFIHRQINLLKNEFNVYVYCSGKVENLKMFPERKLYVKRRNFYFIKSSKLFMKFFNYQHYLSVNPKLSFQQKRYFENHFIQNNISIIHAHFGPSSIEILPIARKLNIPLIVTFHGYDVSVLLKYNIYKQNIKNVLQYAQIFVVAKSMESVLNSVSNHDVKISIIRCGIPIEKFNYVKRESILEKYKQNKKIRFIQVSNFVEKKGHQYTIKTFAQFLSFYDNIEVIFAGNGYLLEKCKKLVNNLKIERYIKFVGHLKEEEVNNLMKSADVFIHHSITATNGDKEGVPTVIMEAMATGLPVISTFHSGISELIDDGINGYLVKEKDIDNYLQCLKNIIFHGDGLKRNTRKTIVERFNLSTEIKKMGTIFNQVIN